MDWLERMNRAMDHIEEHLDQEVDYNEIARIVCCPPGLFQRVFAVLTDVPMSEYVRRRRLSKAAEDLCMTAEKVIDVAVKYGYDSPDAFTVAFKRLHGISPVAARERGTMLKAYPKLTFSLVLKGDTEMNYRIEQKPAFQATGRVLVTSNENGGNYQSIPAFWQKCDGDGTIDKLFALKKNAITGGNLLGICYGAQSNGSFSYMIGIGTEGTAAPEGMETLDIPASTWAVFESVGPMPGAIQAMWKRVLGEFLPNSAYRHAGTPDFELYYPGDNDENYRSEVWIPVVKK